MMISDREVMSKIYFSFQEGIAAMTVFTLISTSRCVIRGWHGVVREKKYHDKESEESTGQSFERLILIAQHHLQG